jgi:hypothetical protein
LLNIGDSIRSNLRQAGYEVEADKSGRIRIWKKAGEKQFEVKGIPFFLSLVQEYLLPDSSVAETNMKNG